MERISNLFSALFVFLFVESLVLGGVFGTFGSALLIGLPTLVVTLYFLNTAAQEKVTRHVVAAGVMVYAALHIHQVYGLVEVHFEIFILMAILIIYQDWKVFITALTVIAIHHLGFFFLQKNNVGIYIFDENRVFFSTVLIHAIYATAEACVAGYIAKLMNDESRTGKELTSITQQLTANTNSIDLTIRANDSKSSTLLSFNDLLCLIDKMISHIKVQVKELEGNSRQLAETKKDLEASSTECQLETEMIASAAEQMSMTVAAISEETQSLNTQMLEANEFTQSSNSDICKIAERNVLLAQSLENTNTQIVSLVRSVSNISKVLEDISSIAEQTNLLALNAAIEAARAGEKGRGFAVVADEVRALANRTKESTNKISDIIDSLQHHSDSSTNSMSESLEVVTAVLEDAEKTKDKIEKATGIVNNATKISINVAVAVEEQSSTMESIAKSTEALKETVRRDQENLKSLSKEAMQVESSSIELNKSIASFK